MTEISVTATELRDRFIIEQAYIQRYVDFLSSKTKFFDSEVRRIIGTLVRHHIIASEDIANISSKQNVDIYGNAQDFLDFIHLFTDKITSSLQKSKEYLDETMATIKPAAKHEQEQWRNHIRYAMNLLEFDMSSQNIEKVRSDIQSSIPTLLTEFGIDIPDLLLKSGRDVVEYTTKSAILLILRKRTKDLMYVMNKIEEIEISTRMSNPDNDINILRQSFIVLVTNFDATIFDITRVGLKRNFFKLIGLFSKQDKLSLESLDKYDSYTEFRDRIIEEQLKTKYLKDLLLLFENQRVQCVNPGSGYKFGHLIEMVNRRNIHIHNRGQVDERYLEKDNNNNPKYNVYNLSIGTIAQIDTRYWNAANILCKNCVTSIAQWAESQPNT
jgi:hypothetical protein